MRQNLSPDICVKSVNVALKLNSAIELSSGDQELMPCSTQWSMDVRIKVNGTDAPFDIAENMLRSFLAGKFCHEADHHMYEQKNGGFIVRFNPRNSHHFANHKRRELERVILNLIFAHSSVVSHSAIFPEMLLLADYCFSRLIHTFTVGFPLIFNKDVCDRLATTSKIFKPIKLALELDPGSTLVEKVAERGMSNTTVNFPSQKKRRLQHIEGIDPSLLMLGISHPTDDGQEWCWSEGVFAEKNFEQRKFIVLTENVYNTHEPVYLNSLL